MEVLKFVAGLAVGMLMTEARGSGGWRWIMGIYGSLSVENGGWGVGGFLAEHASGNGIWKTWFSDNFCSV